MTRSSIRRDVPAPACPTVRFAPEFAARVERFTELTRARLARREEFGRSPAAPGGHDFVGYRPYHVGDDPRTIDWAAYARSDRPLVRLTRREAGERWAIVIDASASMGVGPPGKLQLAAETAVALCSVARRSGAVARVIVPASDATAIDASATTPDGSPPASVGGVASTPRVFDVSARTRLADVTAFLERVTAAGSCRGSDLALAPTRAGVSHAARVFVLSDLLSAEPAELMALSERHRSVSIVRVLAPAEWDGSVSGNSSIVGDRVEWVDPEQGTRVRIDVDARTRERYEEELGVELERWRRAAGRARVRHDVHASTAAFEDVAARALERDS